MKVNLRGTGSNKKRNEISQLQLAFANTAGLSNDLVTLSVRNVTIRYSTAHYNGAIYSGYVGDDLVDGSLLYTPENANEKRNPKKEDAYIAARLVEHLNSNLEHYNRELFQKLDPDRRLMLLDGFLIETYNDFGVPIGKRSLASVVKNDLVGISGNALIMPVAPGYKVDRSYVIEQPIEGPAVVTSLFDHYKPLTPIPPYRISIPSKGVFAEAVQGACDACEKVKDNTSQDWDKFKTDEPTAINPVTVPVPTVTDWRAAFKDLATPIVNIQNAPATPAPGAGLAASTTLLGQERALQGHHRSRPEPEERDADLSLQPGERQGLRGDGQGNLHDGPQYREFGQDRRFDPQFARAQPAGEGAAAQGSLRPDGRWRSEQEGRASAAEHQADADRRGGQGRRPREGGQGDQRRCLRQRGFRRYQRGRRGRERVGRGQRLHPEICCRQTATPAGPPQRPS